MDIHPTLTVNIGSREGWVAILMYNESIHRDLWDIDARESWVAILMYTGGSYRDP